MTGRRSVLTPATTSAVSPDPPPSGFPVSVCPRSAWVFLTASQDSVPRSPPTISTGSSASAPEDASPLPSSSYGRSPPHPDCVLPFSALAPGSPPGRPLPSDARTSLSFRRSAKFGLVSPLSAHRGCTTSAYPRSPVGYRCCCARDSNPLL